MQTNTAYLKTLPVLYLLENSDVPLANPLAFLGDHQGCTAQKPMQYFKLLAPITPCTFEFFKYRISVNELCPWDSLAEDNFCVCMFIWSLYTCMSWGSLSIWK